MHVVLVVHEKIVGLDVAVHPSLVVHVVDGFGALDEHFIEPPMKQGEIIVNLLLEVGRLE
jgi:hypothetical protein